MCFAEHELSLPKQFLAPGLFSWIPRCCAVCGKWPTQGLCATCYTRFKKQPVRCKCCAVEMPKTMLQVCGACLSKPYQFDDAVAAVAFIEPWRALVHQLKFYNATESAWIMARLLHLAVLAKERKLPNYIVPVGGAPARMRLRGYNQAWELARHLARMIKIPANSNILVRKDDDFNSQIHRKRKERFKALKNAFEVLPEKAPLLNEKHIAVVDDVMTTGATLQAAARALKRAGAAKVSVWVFARTPQGLDQR